MKKFRLHVIKLSKLFFIISGILTLITFTSLAIQGLNFGIDFVGGTITQIELHTTFETSDIRQITDQYDPSCEITSGGDDQTQVIISSKVDFTDEQKVSFFNDFKSKYNLSDDDLLSFDNVSPTIGKELQQQALYASVITVVCILIYVTFRFEFYFGLTAIIALVHDLLIVLGVYTLFQLPVNSSFIAAMLTILGYSINDTIVVFDRIRENRRKYSKFDYGNLIDDSINQTLARSINTSLTTVMAITALYIVGVSSIREFILPLILGFISGTYSSIFIASSLWYVIKNNQAKKIQAKLKTR
ncbi:MAG: protein translocase subunit SecF [Anaerofustis sp.]